MCWVSAEAETRPRQTGHAERSWDAMTADLMVLAGPSRGLKRHRSPWASSFSHWTSKRPVDEAGREAPDQRGPAGEGRAGRDGNRNGGFCQCFVCFVVCLLPEKASQPRLPQAASKPGRQEEKVALALAGWLSLGSATATASVCLLPSVPSRSAS